MRWAGGVGNAHTWKSGGWVIWLGHNLGPIAEFGASGEMDPGISKRKVTVSALVPHKLDWHGAGPQRAPHAPC